MHIAIFTDTYTPDINGVATSSRILRNELVKHGHEVVIVTGELPSDSSYIDNPDDNILRVPGIELKKIYGYRASNIYSFKIMSELRRRSIDLVHCQTEFGVGIFSRIVAETLDIPIVYTYHTMWADYSHYFSPVKSGAVEGLVKKMITRMSKVYGGHCSELIVPSTKTADALAGYGLDKQMHIIPTGLELSKFDVTNLNLEVSNQIKNKYSLEGKFVITFLGRIAPEKSIDMIIDALEKIDLVKNPFCFLIVGGGPSLDDLKQRVENENLGHYVTFTGPQDHEMVPYYYNLSDIFISASMSETQGLTFIEAMACKTPVLARFDDNLKDVIQDGYNGFFFNTTDELTALVEKIMEMDLTELSDNALASTEKFSSTRFYSEVIKVYTKALERYQKDHIITKISVLDNNKNLVYFRVDNDYITITVNDEACKRYQFEVNNKVSSLIIRELIDNEKIVKAYGKALKYLSYRDYTKNQMKKKLLGLGEYSEYQAESVVSLLEDKNLINDDEYALAYLKRCMRQKTGINKAVHHLLDARIPTEVIDRCIAVLEDDEEYQAAIDLIDKTYTKAQQFSYKSMIQRVREKLYVRGFTKSTIERAINDYNFEYSYEQEMAALNNDYQKVLTKYRRRVTNKQLHDKVINVLLKKGYNYDDIKSIMSEGE